MEEQTFSRSERKLNSFEKITRLRSPDSLHVIDLSIYIYILFVLFLVAARPFEDPFVTLVHNRRDVNMCRKKTIREFAPFRDRLKKNYSSKCENFGG